MADPRVDSAAAYIAAQVPGDFNLCPIVAKFNLDDGADYTAALTAALTAVGLTITTSKDNTLVTGWCEKTWSIE
tara:strand:- start:234 stop:455 length:222 start_codon:yes stop_codon:yes gene_type:complete